MAYLRGPTFFKSETYVKTPAWVNAYLRETNFSNIFLTCKKPQVLASVRLLGAGADAGGCLGPASAHLQGPLNIYTCTEDQVWQKSVIFIKKIS